MNKNKINDIERIVAHNKAQDLIKFNINNKDTEGYIYCIQNNLFDGYNKKVYKISSTINIEQMLLDHNISYFQNTNLIRKIHVQKKLFYEYMIILRLHKQRIKTNKNFYINLKEINLAFDEMEKLLAEKSVEYIHNYYLKFMDNFNKEKYCSINLKIIKKADVLPENKLFKNKQMKINLNSDKSGYIYWIMHPYINDYFGGQIQIIIPTICDEVSWIKSNFIEDIKIIKVLNVKYLDIAKNIIYELTYLSNIKSYYYIMSKQRIEELFQVIEKYFTTYTDKFQLNFAFGKRVFALSNYKDNI